MALVLKTSDAERHRGFESLSLRHFSKLHRHAVPAMEKYPRGRRGSPAKGVVLDKGSPGSNPGFSAMNTDNSWYENDSSMRWVIFMSCIMGLHMQDSDEICRNTRFASKRLCSSQTRLATVRIMMHTPAHPLVLFQFIPGIRAILHTPNEPQRESTLVVAHRQIAYSTPRSECENR